MKWQEDNLDVLQNLEFAVVEVWRAHPEMTDHAAQRAYETARQFYRAEQRGKPAVLPPLTGLEAETFAAVRQMCEFRLGRDPGPPPRAGAQDIEVPPVSLEKLIACLQELGKSVERHTRAGGRQGYLQFIDHYLK